MSTRRKIIWSVVAALVYVGDLYLYSASVLYSSMQAIIWPYTVVKSSIKVAFLEQYLYLGIIIICLAKNNSSLLFKIFTYVFAVSRFIVGPILTSSISWSDIKWIIAIIFIIATFSDFKIIRKIKERMISNN